MPARVRDQPALTADVVVLALGEEEEPNVLLIRRGSPPFQGTWALPGGFVNVGESPRQAASRELAEETGIRGVPLAQLRVFGDPGRDPRGHTVTVAYLAVVVAGAAPREKAGSDADQVHWWSIGDLPPLAFDHAEILACAYRRLCSTVTCGCEDAKPHNSLPAELSVAALSRACRLIRDGLHGDKRRGQT